MMGASLISRARSNLPPMLLDVVYDERRLRSAIDIELGFFARNDDLLTLIHSPGAKSTYD